MRMGSSVYRLIKSQMWNLFKITSLYYFFASSFAWWSFSGLPRPVMLVAVNVCMLLALMFCNFKIKFTKKAAGIFILILILSAFSTYLIHLSYGLATFFSYLPALFLYILPKRKKRDLLIFVTKWYCIVMGISLVVYACVQIGILSPIDIFKVPDNSFYPPYRNYIFFIESTMYDSLIYRFNGPFLEPGHQAMISGLLLFANRYRFKQNKLLWIPLIAIIISFSLAGYIILIIGIIFIYVRSAIKLFGIALIYLTCYVFVSEVWDGGNNPVNILIFDRLEYDDEKGISGNNRTVAFTDYYFDKCLKDGKLILGERNLAEDNKRMGGAGYKIFLLRYGLISLIMVGYLYLLLISPKANRRYALTFFLLIILVFIQRAYPTWYSWILPYVLGIGITSRKRYYLIKIDHSKNSDLDGSDSDVPTSNGKSEITKVGIHNNLSDE